MGILYDHFGHRFSASVSAAMIAVGYTLSALSAYGYLPTSYLLLSFFYFVVGQVLRIFQEFSHYVGLLWC